MVMGDRIKPDLPAKHRKTTIGKTLPSSTGRSNEAAHSGIVDVPQIEDVLMVPASIITHP